MDFHANDLFEEGVDVEKESKSKQKSKSNTVSSINIGKYSFSITQIVLGIGGVILLALLIVYYQIASGYKTTFLKGTKINGVNVSEMNANQAAGALAKSAEAYSIDIEFREDEEETIESKDIDFHYEPNADLQNLLAGQNRFLWMPAKMGLSKASYNVQAKFDEKKLEKKAASFKELKKKHMKKPIDAHPVYEDGKFRVEKEYEGTTINKKDFVAALSKNISAEEEMMIAEEEANVYTAPKIREDDKTLNDQIPFLNETVNASLTYDLHDGSKRTLDGNDLIKWLECKDGVYSKNDEKWDENLNAFVEELWEQEGTMYKPHKFKAHDGTVRTVSGVGYYGYSLDKDKELKKLNEKDLKPGKVTERKPYYLSTEASTPDDNYGFGQNYVEVDLSQQVLWVYEDGEEVFSCSVVSGLPSGGRMTPDGCYVASDKHRGKWLTGANYRSWVNYWIRLTGNGVGLHDATWRGSFGGSIWRSNGSHGCINLPYYAAATIYDMVPEGEPVIVYYE